MQIQVSSFVLSSIYTCSFIHLSICVLICVLFMKRKGLWTEAGRTEISHNNPNPGSIFCSLLLVPLCICLLYFHSFVYLSNCVLFMKRKGHWTEARRTEINHNNANPGSIFCSLLLVPLSICLFVRSFFCLFVQLCPHLCPLHEAQGTLDRGRED